MAYAGCVFCCWHSPPTFTGVGHECPHLLSLYAMECVHRLDLSLYSHPKEFLENGVRTHANSMGKISSTRSSEEDQTHDGASCRTASPTHYQLSYSGPMDRNQISCLCDSNNLIPCSGAVSPTCLDDSVNQGLVCMQSITIPVHCNCKDQDVN